MNENLNTQSDELLVKKVQEGDTNAYNVLVIKYQYKVAQIISKFVANNADINDIAQDAFINAYKAINVLQKALFSNNGEIINAEDFIEAEKDTLDKKEENIVIPSDFQDKIKNAKESLTTIEPSKKSDIKESAFECDKFAEAIFSQIREKVGEPFSGSSSFCAVPYKTRSRILVSSQFFISLIEEVSKCSRGEAIKRANYFVKYYGSKDSNPRYIYDINVTKGYYTSIYFLVENGKKFEYICVPFDRKALNIDNAKMDYYTKKETLKNIKIEQFMQF